jgi:hypothetical protein
MINYNRNNQQIDIVNNLDKQCKNSDIINQQRRESVINANVNIVNPRIRLSWQQARVPSNRKAAIFLYMVLLNLQRYLAYFFIKINELKVEPISDLTYLLVDLDDKNKNLTVMLSFQLRQNKKMILQPLFAIYPADFSSISTHS